MTHEIDPRPSYERALSWANGLVVRVDPAVLDGPTPCSEYNVRMLLGHLVATVDRARAIGEGGDPRAMPTVVAGVPDDGWADALAAATDKMWAVWGDEGLLDRPVTCRGAPYRGAPRCGATSTRRLCTGGTWPSPPARTPRADPELAEAALAGARAKIPAERRGGPIPFADVVEPAPDAGPTERLANWSGHRRS